MQERRQPEIIAGRVNADGSIATGDGFTVQKTGAGLYTVTFSGTMRLVSATTTANTGGLHGSTVYGFTGNAFNVVTFLIGSGGSDQPFNFVAVGVQT